jgi:hypothetical protein
MAAMADRDPASAEAWYAARFWAMQSMAAAASAHQRPSVLENDLAASREAASRAEARQAKYEADECGRAMKSALSKTK